MNLQHKQILYLQLEGYKEDYEFVSKTMGKRPLSPGNYLIGNTFDRKTILRLSKIYGKYFANEDLLLDLYKKLPQTQQGRKELIQKISNSRYGVTNTLFDRLLIQTINTRHGLIKTLVGSENKRHFVLDVTLFKTYQYESEYKGSERPEPRFKDTVISQQ